jgi:hypothetical protein
MKIVVLLAVMVFTFSACRKKELIDTDFYDYMTFVYDDPKCSNGVLDSLEAFIDCGGPCGPCANIEVPCVTTKNTQIVKFNQSTIGNYSFSDAQVTSTLNPDGSYKVVLVSGNDKLTFTLGGKIFEKPSMIAKSVTEYYVSGNTETFHVSYYKDFQTLSSYNGIDCYVNYKDGKFSFDFCSLPFTAEVNLKGNITFSI